MKKEIVCADHYEAQKLASLIYIKDDKEIFINGILDIIENEIVISLKDKSAHSVLFQDREQADLFADYIQSVIENIHTIKDTKVVENIVEITKE
jgi:predicted choloylglycine hydrolase